MLMINADITIPDDELHFQFARSGGPGGQNVNKVNSKAILHWNVAATNALPEAVKSRFLARFASRLTSEGVLVLHSQEHRTQLANEAACLERVREMIVAVLRPPRRRIPTKPTQGSVRRRLEDKTARGERKKQRRWSGNKED